MRLFASWCVAAFLAAGSLAGGAAQPAALAPPPAQESRPTLRWIRDRADEDPVQYSATCYVSPAGSDRNNGSKEAPFATIQRAAELAKPGTRIRVLAGLYNAPLTITNSGAAGKPITFEGEIGPGGERLAVIYPAKPLRGWAPAPDVGQGVYKLAAPGFDIVEMEAGLAKVPRINDRWMKEPGYFGITGFDVLKAPADGGLDAVKRKGRATSPGIKFWDATGAVFGCVDGKVYARFRNGEDPNVMDVRAAPGGAAVTLSSVHHVIVRGFYISGAEVGVTIRRGSCDNVIERNVIANGRVRLEISGESSRNHVRHNEIKANFLSDYRPGAWGEPSQKPHYFASVRQTVYLLYKFMFGVSSSDDYACTLYGCTGADNEVYGNHIHDGLVGLSGGGAPGNPLRSLKVYNNIFHNFSSVGTSVFVHQLNTEYHDNLFYDCNINMRIHRLHEEGDTIRDHRIYRNFFFNPNGVGHHHFFHFQRYNLDLPVSLFFYQNSYAGGADCISGVSLRPPTAGRLPGVVFLNNVFSGNILLNANKETVAEKGALGPVDYNWLGGVQWHGVPPWFGEHNILAEGKKMWEDTRLPGFQLAADSPCRNAGLDLSKPFALEGKTLGPLPGMKPGYFQGARPDLGALQYGEKPFFAEFIEEIKGDPKARVAKTGDAGALE